MAKIFQQQKYCDGENVPMAKMQREKYKLVMGLLLHNMHIMLDRKLKGGMDAT